MRRLLLLFGGVITVGCLLELNWHLFDATLDASNSESSSTTQPDKQWQQGKQSDLLKITPTQSPNPISLVDTGLNASEKSLLSTCLIPPRNAPYRFRRYKPESGKHNSQFGQSQDVDRLLRGMANGFVVESGALDGESHSNSIFFEVQRNWSCLLVEANPKLQEKIVGLNRRCHLLKGGLSLNRNVSSFKFILAQAVGGIVDVMAKATIKGIQQKIKDGKMSGSTSTGEIVDVPCFPLHHVVRALGRTVVDYWSLDTEGSETNILQATDFTMIEVGVMTIEHQQNDKRRTKILQILVRNGFIRAKAGGTDDVYVNRNYCKKRQIKIPQEV